MQRGERIDLVFVDGSELALDVLVHAALSWQMLAPGGYVIFDNYGRRSPLGEVKHNEVIIRRTADV